MNEMLSTRIRQAIARGACHLVDRQQADGYWRDRLVPGAGTEWVTAFVGYALSGAGGGHAEPVALGLSALDASCRETGWGYNDGVATDADSSAWATRWYARLGMPMAIDAVDCLAAYLGPEGGARTFASAPRYGRWIQEHADVTAARHPARRRRGCTALPAQQAPGRNLDGARQPAAGWRCAAPRRMTDA